MNGTNPSILIDYNDNSPVSSPVKGILHSSYSFNHSFPGSGYFTACMAALVKKIYFSIPDLQ